MHKLCPTCKKTFQCDQPFCICCIDCWVKLLDQGYSVSIYADKEILKLEIYSIRNH